MQPNEYRAFTATLAETLARDPRVVGLIALGSMAEQDYAPDRWSDHDFFVITEPGAQEAFRTDLSWLPDHQRIAFRLREGPHALRVVDDTGHILELVVFDADELNGAYANRRAFTGDDLAQHASFRRGNFDGDFIGLKLDERFVLADGVAGFLHPLRDGGFADTFAEGRHNNIGHLNSLRWRWFIVTRKHG